MNRYTWLNIPYRQLVAYYKTKHRHHALLLHSHPGNGRGTLAYMLIRWLLCQKSNNGVSCSECHACKLIQAGNHPDCHLLVPEKGKNTVGIEPIRLLIEKLCSYARQGEAKVIWIPEAEILTEAASNALLKTLEEPQEKTYFLLGCREPSRLLATLRSRCLYWYLSVPNEEISMRWLSNCAVGTTIDHLTALRLNCGGPIAAKKLLQPINWKQRSILCCALSDALLEHNMLSLLPILSYPDVGVRLHWVCTLLLDSIKTQQGASRYVINQDQRALVHQMASQITDISLLKIVQKWIICRHNLLSVAGVDRELLLTEQLLNWEKTVSVNDYTMLSFI